MKQLDQFLILRGSYWIIQTSKSPESPNYSTIT